MNVRKTPAVEVPGEIQELFSLIRAAFSQRRKTAANAISNGLQLPKATVLSALEAAHLDPRSRPEQLTLQDYCALQAALQAGEIIYFSKKSQTKRPPEHKPCSRAFGASNRNRTCNLLITNQLHCQLCYTSGY